MKKKLSIEPSRSFGGILKDFKDAEEKAFQQKHLNAYLHGWEYFRHGYTDYKDPLTEMTYRIPAWFKTNEIWS